MTRGLIFVSIHAPVWGATRAPARLATRRRGFNPRPRVGGDCCARQPDLRYLVSIHAPRVGGDANHYR